MTMTAHTYRAAALEGASHLGLLLATYDVLAEDIRLAGEAAAAAHIEERCRLSGHAALLLGHLESWVPLLEEPVLETSLIRFYAHIRSELMRLQTSVDGEGFADLALQVGETRAAWQHKGDNLRSVQAREPQLQGMIRPDLAEPVSELRFSCSA